VRFLFFHLSLTERETSFPYNSEMQQDHRLRLKTFFMILVMVSCANAGDLMLKRGMTQIGNVPLTASGLQHAFLATVTSGTIWLAILFLIGFTTSYMLLMSWADYSYVMPAGAFGYALVTLLAVIFLHESVSPRRWIGVVLICAGVLTVGLTKPRTTDVISEQRVAA
jgi:drug/metabolite transporter (DMT)-like permease